MTDYDDYDSDSDYEVDSTTDEDELEGGARRTNRWIRHVMKYWRAHPSISYATALQRAKKSYKKVKKTKKSTKRPATKRRTTKKRTTKKRTIRKH